MKMNVNISGALSNNDLEKWAYILNIPLRGIYMIDTLPDRILNTERVIVNLDKYGGIGTHWIAYIKRGRKIWYFDPIGSLQPPRELIKYWKKQDKVEIYYNPERLQRINSDICGHLCLLFLANQL